MKVGVPSSRSRVVEVALSVFNMTFKTNKEAYVALSLPTPMYARETARVNAKLLFCRPPVSVVSTAIAVVSGIQC